MATIKDVAQRANVSPSTVSAVLTGRVAVKEKTKKRVEAAIKELEYTRNFAARSLRTKSSKLLALVVSDISNRHFATLAKTVSSIGRQRGYTTLIADTGGDPSREAAVTTSMLEQQVDGLLLEASQASEHHRHWLEENISNLPCILVENGLPNTRLATMQLNNYAMGKKAVQHLYDHGHRKIGVLWGDLPFSSAQDRKQGCLDQLDKLGLKNCKEWVVDARFCAKTARERTHAFLSKENRPTALIALNDAMTVGALGAVNALDLKIPEDLSFLGFDSFELADHMTPALSLFEHDEAITALATEATKCLIGSIEGKNKMGPQSSMIFESKFVQRASVRHV
ncbi:LacI family DNA-binding transcriptional regulator [Cognatishimia sp.]|uniref:LacI family DNA-binding transcriptional regulator n=1 Tax=Cognatishimia sp. TaxID=2211648 RepID=UPI003515CCB2